jgi:acyl-CoA synthetase (AMP-forming)/AMP-acid ligase II
VVVTTERRVPALAALTSVPVASGEWAGAPPAAATPAAHPDDPAMLLYTSGTTSRPKGIVCPHRAIVWAARAIAERVGYGPADIVYCRVPVSFDYGLYQLFLSVLAGAEVVYPPGRASARELVEIRESNATVVPVVPTLALLLGSPRATAARPRCGC